MTEVETGRRDPSTKIDLFRESGVPDIESPLGLIYDYVAAKAEEVGQYIKKNRGVPHTATEAGMMTQDEKALLILARACGVPWSEVMDRLQDERAREGRDLLPGTGLAVYSGISMKYGKVVDNIRSDILESMEAIMPLVGGQARLVWRARMVELCRQEIQRLACDPDIDQKTRFREIRSVDTLMRPHLNFFDDILDVPDLSKALRGPGDQLREQAAAARASEVAAVEEAFERGEITEVEKIDRMRVLLRSEDV